MKRMNTKILRVFVVLLICAGQVSANSLDILSVNVIPSQPSNTDLITFSISGWAGNGGSYVDHDVFFQNGTALQLDLYVWQGITDDESNWDYSKQIQPLVQGTYNLEVRALGYFSGTVEDTYTVDFTVVPEPCTFGIFGFGLPLLRFFLKRKV